MDIRRTTEDDLPELCQIVSRNYDRETAEHFFDEANLSFSTRLGRPQFYTAVEGGRLLGCAGYGPSWLTYGVYSLFWVNVPPDWRLKGIGKQLVQRCLRDLTSRADVVVLATTVPDFYWRNWGFTTILESDMSKCNTIMALRLSKLP
jgi:N-acetylglutamate synthase-like GNAT family acetyltransferase